MIFITASSTSWEEDYHRIMSERVREKMESSQHLDDEDHDWIRSVGMEVHTVSHHPEAGVTLPPGDSLHIAVMMPFLDQ